jgi:N-acetylglucosaminyldiphosphoundecaprenol N-acetyl-beta-D-mannosaminyltransferase
MPAADHGKSRQDRRRRGAIMLETDILGVRVHAQRFPDAVHTLHAWAEGPARRYVCACPVYTLMLCREDPAVRNAVQGADMIAADGMPVVWEQRRRGGPQAERIYGPDLMLALCNLTAGEAISHFFWGGKPGVAERLAECMTARFPGLRVAGAHSPPFRPIGPEPDREAIERINATPASIVWVGLGSPKQDLWMAQHRPALNAPLLIGVGAAFDFLSGAKRQAPHWMRQRGLEWLFRLAQEPRRLARRYLVYNPRFMLAVLAERRRWRGTR